MCQVEHILRANVRWRRRYPDTRGRFAATVQAPRGQATALTRPLRPYKRIIHWKTDIFEVNETKPGNGSREVPGSNLIQVLGCHVA